MGNQAGNVTLATRLSDLIAHWQRRADMFYAAEASTIPGGNCHFVVSSDLGAIRVNTMRSGGGRLYVSSLVPFYGTVDVHPDRVVEYDRHDMPLSEAGLTAVLELLDPHLSEIAPLVEIPYGFVLDGTIVAITFTRDVDAESETDRLALGLYPEIYVADADSFRQLSQPPRTLAAWYQHFWSLVHGGHAIGLNQRVRRMPGEIWERREGGDAWLEVATNDGHGPGFMTGMRYMAWDWRTNEPSR
jgi:hypothetical protein